MKPTAIMESESFPSEITKTARGQKAARQENSLPMCSEACCSLLWEQEVLSKTRCPTFVQCYETIPPLFLWWGKFLQKLTLLDIKRFCFVLLFFLLYSIWGLIRHRQGPKLRWGLEVLSWCQLALLHRYILLFYFQTTRKNITMELRSMTMEVDF